MNQTIKKMKKLFSFFLLLLSTHCCISQDYQGKINPVSQNGLHQILLTPDMRSASKNDCNHIRITDAKNKEVPYVIFNSKSSASNYENISILSKAAIPNVSTTIVVSNADKQKIDHLLLNITNTEVEKRYNISGSNDRKEWFGLVNNQFVSDLEESGKLSVNKIFSFPLNDYKFIKIDFADKNSLPINVESAGIEKIAVDTATKIELQDFEQKISTDSKNKKTFINIAFKTPQIIDGIGFHIAGPNYYLRDARIVVKKTRPIKKTEENYLEVMSYIRLNSKTNNQFDISEMFIKEFTIEIDNNDNPELEIKKIALFQTPVKIIADLKAGENYSFKIDNTLQAPNYDLAESGINLEQDYPITNVSHLEIINAPAKEVSAKKFWQKPLFMWICIIVAIAIIGYFSIVMIKDLNKEN